ncbi:glycosyltransferase family 2 protein [Alienimonas sp. DA493]|uniref:glycosyltransferase family 2 protein n=1 Tax=Alienimonas sp. DA493 TaxID=3373605 RepID=UPI00375525EB
MTAETDAAPPRVSVVMGVYNAAETLPAAVEGVLAQTFADWEFVIVDDGSTDGTANRLAEYAAAEPRVRVIRQENAGLTAALIRGCREARGEFIARQDADDVSAPERLERQVALLRDTPGAGFVSCTTRYVAPGGETLDLLSRPADPAEATRALLHEHQGPPAHGSVLFRRDLYDAVGGYRKEFYYAQDSDLWLRMAERALVAYVPEPLYDFRLSPHGISGSREALQRRFGEFGQACARGRRSGSGEAVPLEGAAVLREEVLAGRAARGGRGDGAGTNYLIATRLLARGDRRAIRYLSKTLRRRPWHLKAWARLAQSGWQALRPPQASGVPEGGGE